MKKLMALFLTIMLLISGAAAESMVEESANLTYEELEIYLAQLGKAALESKETVVSTSEEGLAEAAFPRRRARHSRRRRHADCPLPSHLRLCQRRQIPEQRRLPCQLDAWPVSDRPHLG